MPPWSESSDLKLCHNIICCTQPAGKSQHPQHIKQKTEAVTLQLEPRTAPNIPAAVAFHFLPSVGPVPAVLYDHDVITHIDHSVMQEHLPVHLLSWEENLPPPVLWWYRYRYNLLHKTPCIYASLWRRSTMLLTLVLPSTMSLLTHLATFWLWLITSTKPNSCTFPPKHLY